MRWSHLMAGMLLGAALAMAVWPSQDNPEVAGEKTLTERNEVTRPSGAELLQAFGDARPRGEKYRSLEALGSLRADGIREALETVKDVGSENDLGWEAKALLVHWARRDPRAALAWSWANFQASRKWDVAVEEIMETWVAGRDPAVLEFLAEVKKRENSIAVDEVGKVEELFLHEDQMMKVQKWLYFYDDHFARLANEQGITPLSQYPRPIVFADHMETSAEIQEAYRYWSGVKNAWNVLAVLQDKANSLGVELPARLESPEPRAVKNSKPSAAALAWSEVRTDVSKAMARVQDLPPGDRHATYLMMFDSWKAVHPDEMPDFEVLPEEAKLIWQDLANLPPLNSGFSRNAYRR